eukprot:jgi/Mesen1/3679/ME000202S02767
MSIDANGASEQLDTNVQICSTNEINSNVPHSTRGSHAFRKRVKQLVNRIGSSIWLKLSLFVGLLVLGTSGVLAFVLWAKAQRALVDGIELRLKTVVTLKAEQINSFANGGISKMELVASRVVLRSVLVDLHANGTRNPVDVARGVQDLQSAIVSIPQYLWVAAVDTEGVVAFSSLENDTGTQLITRAELNSRGEQGYLGPPYKSSQHEGLFVANVTAPIFQNNVRIGSLFAVLNATALKVLMYSQTGLQSSGEITSGYTTPASDRIMFVLPPRLDPSVVSTDKDKPLHLAIEGKTGYLSGVRDYRGVKVALAYAPVGYQNWGAVAKEDEHQAYGPVKRFKDTIVISIVCILFAGLIASYILSKIATAPIVHLSKAAGALAAGDMNARASRRHRKWEDEIDALRHTFNNMADQLSTAYSTLESKVEERTAELARANQVLAREVAERTKMERELQAARNVAVAADRMKSEWIANMSHEIRTPLNGVINCTELCLGTPPLTDEQHEYLELSLFSAKHLLRLISDILDFSKIEAGKLSMESIEFSLYDQMEHAVAVLATRAHSKGLELLAHPRARVPDHVVGDPSRLFQIFVNLIGNSIKFTNKGQILLSAAVHHEAGGPPPTTAAAGSPASEVELVFTPGGCEEKPGCGASIGIPREKQSLLFQAFSQVDASTTRVYGGTGLGLVISSKLAHAMGGRMWVDSQEGAGSTFSFTARFPLPPPSSSPPVTPSSPSTAASLAHLRGVKVLVVDSSAASTSLLVDMLQGVKVLVVDSSAACTSLLVDMLQRWGLRAEGVSDGEAAVRRLEAEAAGASPQPFQLLLLDLHLPPPHPSPPPPPSSQQTSPGSSSSQGLVELLRRKPHLLGPSPIATGGRGVTPGSRGGGLAGGASSGSAAGDEGGEGGELLQSNRAASEGQHREEVDPIESFGTLEVDLELDLPDWVRKNSNEGLSPHGRLSASDDAAVAAVAGLSPVPSPRDVRRQQPRQRLVQSKSMGAGSGRDAAGSRLGSRWLSLPAGGAQALLPLVILTCRDLGIDLYVSKPVKRSVLLRGLQLALHLPPRPTPPASGSGSQPRPPPQPHPPPQQHLLSPLQQQQKATQQAQPQAPPPSAGPAAAGGGEAAAAEAEALHILVVEDNAINQKVILTLLHKWGHSTELAANGAIGVDKYAAGAFDVVLMDVQMPVLDGIGATVQIREGEKASGRYTPIVAMTAHASKEVGAKCLAAGMDEYLSKPLNSSKLRGILRLVAEKALPRSGAGGGAGAAAADGTPVAADAVGGGGAPLGPG